MESCLKTLLILTRLVTTMGYSKKNIQVNGCKILSVPSSLGRSAASPNAPLEESSERYPCGLELSGSNYDEWK